MRYEDESDSGSDEFEPEEEFDSDISKTISISESKNSDNITTDNSIAKINHVGNKQESSTAELKSSKAVRYEDESDSYSDEESESEEEANDENSETIKTKNHVGSISGKLVNNLQENVITEEVTSARMSPIKNDGKINVPKEPTQIIHRYEDETESDSDEFEEESDERRMDNQKPIRIEQDLEKIPIDRETGTKEQISVDSAQS